MNKTTIERLEKKLCVYEALEMDIDETVERVGKDEARFEEGKLLFQIARNPERRIQQAVALAHRLVETQKQRDEALKSTEELKAQNSQLEELALKAKEDLARVAQPTGYLVMKLREEEALKHAWIQKHRALEGELSKLSQDRDHQREEVEQLRDKLSSLLRQREEIESLRELVEAWQQAHEEAEEDFETPPVVEENSGASQVKVVDSSMDVHAHAEGKTDDEVSFTELGLSPDLVRRMLTPPSRQRQVQ
jgi:myosin heavy subunit